MFERLGELVSRLWRAGRAGDSAEAREPQSGGVIHSGIVTIGVPIQRQPDQDATTGSAGSVPAMTWAEHLETCEQCQRAPSPPPMHSDPKDRHLYACAEGIRLFEQEVRAAQKSDDA